MQYRPEFLLDEFNKPAKHFWFKGVNSGVIYPLIQKNGCSTFKNFLNSRVHYRGMIRKFWDTIMLRQEIEYQTWPYWRIQLDERNMHREKPIFVYRDPFERMVSIFKNKFVDDSGSRKISRSFARVMHKDPEEATFRDFLIYASRPFQEIDGHLWPQKSRLWSAAYYPIRLDNLFEEMKNIVGPDAADLYFAKPINASYKGGYSFQSRVVDVPVAELRRARSLGKSIARDELATDEVLMWVRKIYWQDYEMIEDHIETTRQ